MLPKRVLHAFVVLLSLVALVSAVTEFEEEDDVIVLTDDTFDAAIAEINPLLVEFYAPWCGHCKQLAPEYVKAAKALKALEPPLRIAKIDATANTKVAERFHISGFPTLKFFKGDPEAAKEYDGGRTGDAIQQWMIKRSGPSVKIIQTAKELDELKETHEVVVFAVLDEEEGKARSTFDRVADQFDEAFFAASTATDLDKDATEAKNVVLFKKFDEGKDVFDGQYVQRELLEFVRTNSMPLVVTFTQEKAPVIFGGDKLEHMITFMDLNKEYRTAMEDALKVPAKENKGKMLHVVIPHTEERILEYFGLKVPELPAIIMVNMTGGMKKYAFEAKGQDLIDKIDTDLETALLEFEKKYLAHELKPTLKSAEPVDDKDDAVKVIVGKEFKERVLDTDKDVLLEFYAPWCGHCKALAPKYEELAEAFADVESIMIAKMDATENEVDHPEVNVKGFPTLMFFKSGDKDHPMLFDGPREVESLSDFLKKHAKKFELDGETFGVGAETEDVEEKEDKEKEDKKEDKEEGAKEEAKEEEDKADEHEEL